MKKALILGLSLSLALTLTACGGSNDNAADSTQDTSTPEVSQSVDTSTPEVEQNTQTTQGNPEQTTPAEETPAPAETTTQQATQTSQQTQVQPEVKLFNDCNETVYATETVNIRSSYSASSDKLGSLTKAQSIKRTGTGTGVAAGWSRVEFNGKEAYINSSYLSTTKPQVSTSTSKPSTSSGTSTSKPSTSTSKPSTSTSKPSTSKPSTSSGSSTSGSKPFTPSTGGVEIVTGPAVTDKEDLDQSKSNNDDSNVGGYYNPETGEFFQ